VAWVNWKLISVHSEIVLISTKDWCTVYAVQLAQKSFWPYLMEVLGDVGQAEAHFDLFGDSVNLSPR
jgi:hypothetical protein